MTTVHTQSQCLSDALRHTDKCRNRWPYQVAPKEPQPLMQLSGALAKTPESDRLFPRRQSTCAGETLVVIDAEVEAADWLAQRVNVGVRVLLLQPPAECDERGAIAEAVDQINAVLRRYPDICHVVIVAHGSPGSLTLGGGWLDREAVIGSDAGWSRAGLGAHAANAIDWSFWRDRLSQISIYSCGVATGPCGADFLQTLQRATGVAIAASTRDVGHSSRGGDWNLDVWVGDRALAESGGVVWGQPFRHEVTHDYPGLLATIVVNSAADNTTPGDDLVTLREAIAAANGDTATDLGDMGLGADTIVFDSALAGSTISLTEGELAIASTLTLDGSATPGLVISGNSASRVFNITGGTTTLTALTIANGSAANGAGIRVEGAGLNLNRSLVTANVDSEAGGGIYATDATVSITNSTLSGNSSAQFGAGLTLDNGSSATVTFSTIASNQGSGIDRVGESTLTVGNTLLADNTRGNIPLSFDNTISLGYNITDDITIGLNQVTDRRAQPDATINLAPLGDYGGPTQIHALLPGSLAIDGGDPASAVIIDQRGVLRPVQERFANRADVGAFEAARPLLTVDEVLTDDSTPALSGTVILPGNFIDPDLEITVTVDGVDYTATNNGDGTWTLADGAIAPLDDDTYDVVVSATNISGTGTDTTTDELVIDATPPMITVDTLFTNDATPALTGTIDDSSATLTVTVEDESYTATNNGDGTWTLADNSIMTALADGTYDVAVSATDRLGNTGSDTTTNELTIDTEAPTVTVDSQITSDATPALSGEVNDPDATVEVLINGVTYIATNNGDGTWSLADDAIAPLPDDLYDVQATATDLAGNASSDATTDELRIDTTAPVITIFPTLTNDTTPELAGTIDEAGATLEIEVNGVTYVATNNGDGSWVLADGAITAALADGTYDVVATATDEAGNVGSDTSTDELLIDAIAPVVTLDDVNTNNGSPALSGSLDDATAIVQVTVNRDSYDATNNLDGTWSLPAGTFTLPDGSYDIEVTAIDAAGNAARDTATLLIDSIPPVVTVDSLETNDATPSLTGTIDDPTATIAVTVDGNDYTAINNMDGTWTLEDDRITPALEDGVYNIGVTATDAVDNTGSDDTTGELLVDATVPVVAVDFLSTNDTTPELTGSVDDPDAVVEVTIRNTYTATNNGDGTWTLADDTITPELEDGFYDVSVVAVDGVGNIGQDNTNNELLIDATAPVVTVNSLLTTDTTPSLSGTVDDDDAEIEVMLNGITYTATNNTDGTWSLEGSLIDPPLLDGTYDIEAIATDEIGNVGSDATTDELILDTTPPGVTVDSLNTNDSTPTITGTVDDAIANLAVTVNGIDYTAINNGDGTWQLTIPDALADGTYDVAVVATDLVGNSSSDSSTDELFVDTTAAVITVDRVLTNDASPALSGSVDDPEAAVRVRVGGRTYVATNNGDGTWSLPDNVIQPDLAENTYNVLAVAIDSVGNISQDQTVGELRLDLTPPTVDIVNVAPDPRGPVDSIAIRFSSVVFGFNRADLTLERDGQRVSLSEANLESSDRINWTLDNLSSATTLTGLYTLSLDAAGSGIIDTVENPLQVGATDTWQVNNFTVSGLPAPRSIGDRTGTPISPIDFRGGRRGLNQQGTNRADTLRGTGRRDRLSGRRGGDRLLGRGSNDRLFGDGGRDTVIGGAGNDRLFGGGRRDQLQGQKGRDRLDGGRGLDELNGGGGNDELIGGGGNDILTGGDNSDTFIFNSLTEGVDTITDFDPTADRIDLRGVLSASQFAAASSFAKLSQFVRLRQIGSFSEISIDADGSGSGEVLQPLILLENTSVDTLVSTNFVV